MKNIKKILAAILALIFILSITACKKTDETIVPEESAVVETEPDIPEETIVHGEPITTESTIILLSNDTILVDGVEISKNTADVYLTTNEYNVVNITVPGHYEISGEATNTQICVDLGDEAQNNENAKVHVYLNNLTVENSNAPVILFKNVYEAPRESVALAEDMMTAGANLYIMSDTVNTITTTYTENEFNSSIYSNMTMGISGYLGSNGILNITSNSTGLTTNKNMFVFGGTILVRSESDGIVAANSESILTINDGYVEVISVTDGNGIVSNGTMVINNGSVYAQASSLGENTSLKAPDGVNILGGSVQATGNKPVDISSENTYIAFEFDEICSAGTYTLSDENGAVLYNCITENDFHHMLLVGDYIKTGNCILLGDFGQNFVVYETEAPSEINNFIFTISEGANRFLAMYA